MKVSSVRYSYLVEGTKINIKSFLVNARARLLVREMTTCLDIAPCSVVEVDRQVVRYSPLKRRPTSIRLNGDIS